MKFVMIVATGAAAALSGCSHVAPHGSDIGGASTAARAGSPDDPTGAIAFVSGIYQQYLRGREPDFSKIYTAELQTAFDNFNGDHDGLGYDPLCLCQDIVGFGYSIQRDDPMPTGRRVEVEITNGGERLTRVIMLVRENGRWRVANIGEGEDALYKPEPR